MSTYLADGIGGTLGDSLALEVGYIGLSYVWYVSSESGTDSSGHGHSREDPFATIPYAVSSATAGDTIVVLGDHNENMAAPIDINKSVVIVGEGSSAGQPTSVWGHDTLGSDEVLTISADNVEIRNIKFTTGEQPVTVSKITVTGDYCKFRGCRFEADYNEQNAIVLVEGDHFLADSCTWISVATSQGTRPMQAITTATSGMTMFRMIGCTVSGGATGWSHSHGAVYIQQGASLTVRIEAMSLLLGSDLELTTGSTGYVSVPTATGGAKVRNI